METDEKNGWFKKYVEQVMSELERLDKNITECNKCVKLKMNKLKPATIVSIFAGLIVLIGLTTGGIWAQYHSGVMERQENTRYMILAEAEKSQEKMNSYCLESTFHQADKRLEVLENNVGNIKEDVSEMKGSMKDLDKRSEKILKTLERLERKHSNSGNN